MCGIIGYIGEKQVLPILVAGLRRLEYRGYDSAGVAIIKEQGEKDKETIRRVRSLGNIDNLEEKLKSFDISGTVGIAHTRWATHGAVTEKNAHPHVSCDEKLSIVHNGIIENYRELKEQLKNSHTFESETDTEILVHYIESLYTGNILEAVQHALKNVRGTYGIVAMHSDHPETLIAARMGSPLVIGIADDAYYIASDATPLIAYTKKVMYMNDGEIAEISKEQVNLLTLNNTHVDSKVEEIEWNEDEAEKQGFDHFMLKEIFDQPQVFEDAIRGRYDFDSGNARLGGINMTDEEMRSINRIILIACGTASYAALAAKYAFERLAGIPTEVDVASEFRYRDPIVDNHTLVFCISQSGETADTLAALREAKQKGAFVRGIVNVIGSTIARETDGGTYIHAGSELAVASTKAYTNMVAVLILYAIQFGRVNRMSVATGQRLIQALTEIPEKIKKVLDTKDDIKKIAEKYKNMTDCFFLGRGVNFPVALEGSIKLKEISYIHSEAYPGGEMKHGPIALLSPDFPVVALLPKDQLYDKMRSNIEEIRARKAPVILVATEGDTDAHNLSDDIMYVSDTMELLQPLLYTIPLQLFAYYIAVGLGRDVDRPRNLAKSVTVE